jgi:hypothetical protein
VQELVVVGKLCFARGIFMAIINLFRYVIQEMFYNNIFDELSQFVEGNPSKLDSNSCTIQDSDEDPFVDFQIRMIDITDSKENEIKINLITSAGIGIGETGIRNRGIDEIERLLRVDCSAVLDNRLQDLNEKTYEFCRKRLMGEAYVCQ